MNAGINRIQRIVSEGIAVIFLCAVFPVFAQEADKSQETKTQGADARRLEAQKLETQTIEVQLNREYIALLDKFLGATPSGTPDYSNIKQLFDAIDSATERNNLPQALTLIKANQKIITDNIDSKEAIKIIEITLDYGVQSLSDHLIQYAQQYAGSYVNANIHYALAVQAYNRQDYDKTLQYLSKIDSSGSLSRSRRDYATLLFGICLQHRSKHREAMKIYERLGKKSKYYTHAQLNLAVAYVRQGWWTDAQIAIEKALEQSKPEKQSEFINRLYVVLGYSQLKNEFYRNARQTFRHVSLDSQYMSRALLGIGLCALNQKDYLGALNAFDRLKKSKDYDLTIAESNLLVPFTIERMKELETASAGYSEAIAYYGVKILEFENYPFNHIVDIPADDPAAKILKPLPKHNLHQLTVLQQMQTATQGSSLEIPTTSLTSRYTHLLKQFRQQQINEHLTQLRSYLSQSQYGFAKLYDENQ